MKLKLTAAALIAAAVTATGASATPSLSYPADDPSYAYEQGFDANGAEFTEAKFKFKKFRSHRGFGRNHFHGKKFGHSKGYSRFGKVAKKGHGHGKFFFGKGFFFK